MSTNDKITLMSNLATMLKAGISIIDAIDSLLEDAKGSQKVLLQTVKDDINQGLHLHESLVKFPQIFNKVSINIIHASEEAGTLDSTLRELSTNYRKQQDFMDHVRGAFTYPALIFLVFSAVFTLILTFVIPRIARYLNA
jgi:type II secretory pathway component PulF